MDGTTQRYDTIVVGGGQAGLAVGYHLKKRGVPFVILDGGDRVGDAWRTRWDSLRLFTPARYDGLPGWRFPAPGWSYPTKDEMGDYLEAYADRFELPVRTRTVVDELAREGDGFVVTAGGRRYGADRVVVASGAHRLPKVPPFASQLDPSIVQMHSSEYRNPTQLRPGGVLLVGVGNSGAEIAHEVARTHPVWLSGAPAGQIPVPHGTLRFRLVLPLVRFMGTHVLTRRTPIGRKVGPKMAHKATPLIRIKLKGLAAAGVQREPRVAGVRDGRPLLEDGLVLDVANVIWCTGFRPEYAWIDLPVFGGDGLPMHRRGVAESEPGLYFVGLLFQFAVTSDVLPGVGRDARYIAKQIASRRVGGRRRATELTPA
jgi:putative flavoprotein involved in K+ transport